jgi:hypothetical protein
MIEFITETTTPAAFDAEWERLRNYPLESSDNSGKSALGKAAEVGNAPLTQRIVDVGGRELLGLGDQYGATPLFLAAQGGHREVVKALLELGANANLATSDNFSIDFFKRRKDGLDSVDFWYPIGATPLFAACLKGRNLDIAKMLLERGAVLKDSNPDTQTPEDAKRRRLNNDNALFETYDLLYSWSRQEIAGIIQYRASDAAALAKRAAHMAAQEAEQVKSRAQAVQDVIAPLKDKSVSVSEPVAAANRRAEKYVRSAQIAEQTVQRAQDLAQEASRITRNLSTFVSALDRKRSELEQAIRNAPEDMQAQLRTDGMQALLNASEEMLETTKTETKNACEAAQEALITPIYARARFEIKYERAIEIEAATDLLFDLAKMVDDYLLD